MVGYVVCNKAELKMREFELYRSYYCGICKSVGKRIGQLPRLTLDYDFVFIAMLLAALSAEKEDAEMQHCLIHPIKKISVTKNNKWIDYTADVMILLVYYNLLDDKNDEHKIRGTVGSGVLAGKAKKLKKKYPKLAEVIEKEIDALTALENENSKELDLCGDTFAKIMEEVFAGEAVKDLVPQDQTRMLKHIGNNLGRWIYFADALDDCEADIKSKSYNPVLKRFEYSAEKETIEEFKQRISGQMDFILVSCLKEIESAYTLLDIKKNNGVLENIIYLGLLKKTEFLLKKGTTKDEKSL